MNMSKYRYGCRKCGQEWYSVTIPDYCVYCGYDYIAVVAEPRPLPDEPRIPVEFSPSQDATDVEIIREDDSEERLERQAQEHLEAAALAAMDLADREYLESAPYQMSDAQIDYEAEMARDMADRRNRVGEHAESEDDWPYSTLHHFVCLRCGYETDEDVWQCPNCDGKEEPTEPTHEPEAPWYCSNCDKGTWQLYRIDGDTLCQQCFDKRTDYPSKLEPEGELEEEAYVFACAACGDGTFADIIMARKPYRQQDMPACTNCGDTSSVYVCSGPYPIARHEPASPARGGSSEDVPF